MVKLKKIVAIGPESTGKSTLCADLAEHYETLWVREFARGYLGDKPEYQYDDLLRIAKGQIQSEEETEEKLLTSLYGVGTTGKAAAAERNHGPFLFVDTDMHVMQVWCEFVYNRCHNWILRQIASRQYDGYLLCNIDLPWEQDNLREYPDKNIREKLFHYYRQLMITQAVPWIEISGGHEERMDKAITFVERVGGLAGR